MQYDDFVRRAEASDVWRWLEARPELRERVSALPDVSKSLSEIAELVRASGGVWRSEADELAAGRRSGAVSVTPFVASEYDQGGAADDGRSDGERFLERLARMLNDPHTHALLDSRAAQYASAALDDGSLEVNAHARRRARTAEVGAGMIARLPAFPQAPLDELLDLRATLGPALTRYRALAAELQELVDASSRPTSSTPS